MDKNWTLLREVREYIDAHPEDWRQSSWRCETGMCFAGTAVALQGGVWFSLDASTHDSRLLLAEADDPSTHVVSAWLDEKDPGFNEYRWNGLYGDQKLPVAVVSAGSRARRLLGLTGDESDDLFYAGNDRDDLDQILGEWAMAEDWSEAYDEDAMRSLRKAALI